MSNIHLMSKGLGTANKVLVQSALNKGSKQKLDDLIAMPTLDGSWPGEQSGNSQIELFCQAAFTQVVLSNLCTIALLSSWQRHAGDAARSGLFNMG